MPPDGITPGQAAGAIRWTQGVRSRDVALPGILLSMRHHLLEALTHSTSPQTRRRELLICAAASFGIASVVALLAWWLLRGGLGAGWEVFTETRRDRGRQRLTLRATGAWTLTILGSLVALLSMLLALFGLYSLAAALLRW